MNMRVLLTAMILGSVQKVKGQLLQKLSGTPPKATRTKFRGCSTSVGFEVI